MGINWSDIFGPSKPTSYESEFAMKIDRERLNAARERIAKAKEEQQGGKRRSTRRTKKCRSTKRHVR